MRRFWFDRRLFTSVRRGWFFCQFVSAKALPANPANVAERAVMIRILRMDIKGLLKSVPGLVRPIFQPDSGSGDVNNVAPRVLADLGYRQLMGGAAPNEDCALRHIWHGHGLS